MIHTRFFAPLDMASHETSHSVNMHQETPHSMGTLVRRFASLFLGLTLATCSSSFALFQRQIDWEEVIDLHRHAVVQVCNTSGTYNPFEPFKTIDSIPGGHGTGFFTDAEGRLLTNYHVIHNAKQLDIALPGITRKKFRVKIIGCKPERDIAFLQLTQKAREELREVLRMQPGLNGHIPYLELGDSNEHKITESLLAIGFPLRSELKWVTGRISGFCDFGHGSNFLQITAPINPGNSGGPSINRAGQVIGINSAGLLNQGHAADNSGLMIPINHVKCLLQDMHKYRVIETNLGYRYQSCSDTFLRAHNMPEDTEGVRVISLVPGSSAEQMGLKIGDIIMRINGHKLDGNGYVKDTWSHMGVRVEHGELFNHMSIGDAFTCTIWRDEKEEVTLNGILPADNPYTVKEERCEFAPPAYSAFGGLVLQPLSRHHGHYAQNKHGITKPHLALHILLGLQGQEVRKFVAFSKVYPNSPAEREKCFSPGDLIDEVNGVKVETLEDIHTVISQSDTRYITIKLISDEVGVLDVEEILQDDPALRALHRYEKSAVVAALEQKFPDLVPAHTEEHEDESELFVEKQ